MKRTALGLLAAAGLVCAFGLEAQATTLDFAQTTSFGTSSIINGTSPGYGDSVNGTSDTFGNYGQGNGFTPNVTTTYQHFNNGTSTIDPGMQLWAIQGGNGAGYGIGTFFNNNAAYFTLTAESGFNVLLNSLEIKSTGFVGVPVTETFSILSGGPAGTLLQTFTYNNSSPQTFSFSGLVAQELTVTFDSWDVGISFANFDQITVAATPIPAALPLFAAALAGLGFARWRKNKQAAKTA
jgi:hypothetical protein